MIGPREIAGRISALGFQLKTVGESGILGPTRPDRAVRAVIATVRGGTTAATAIRVAAIKHPDRVAVIDELGSLTFDQLDRRSNALAHGMAGLGVSSEHGIGIMCRNHRGFLEALLAASKLGADAVLLNTMFSGPQLAEVVEREGASVLVFDQEFEDLLSEVPDSVTRIIGFGSGGDGQATVESLIGRSDAGGVETPEREPRTIILTSGTTGAPKGARRGTAGGLAGIAGLFDRIPHRDGEVVVVASPLFHSWGLINTILSLALGATLVLDRRFDPAQTMRRIDQQSADVLVAVPVMLQRILELPDEQLADFRADNLKIVTLSGSALPGGLATAWMDRFGDNIYNLYGSTEVSFVTVADPQDLRQDPATAGRPPHGTSVRLLDDEGNDVEPGETGRVFVSNGMGFDGYTGGENKERLGDYIASGDVGHFDDRGLFFVDGRDDEMIVSGGENLFPAEVEDMIASHPDVVEAAAVGVDDEAFGQVLRAFVVLRVPGALDEDEVKAFVRSNLASFKAPKQVVFLSELPRNATGKILKRSLA
ncbi:MAG: AMP-binding protein [Solirubrobacterales bacterium]|nr:AMP-binding protein [Solirubrobacterales bacterium]